MQGKKEEKENTEHTLFDEIKENKVPKAPENQEQQHVPQTLTNVRISTSLSRPPKRFSPSQYSLLMTDSSEPKCYEEAMQVETRKKWKKGMNEEMDPLVRIKLGIWLSFLHEKEHCRISGFTG